MFSVRNKLLSEKFQIMFQKIHKYVLIKPGKQTNIYRIQAYVGTNVRNLTIGKMFWTLSTKIRANLIFELSKSIFTFLR